MIDVATGEVTTITLNRPEKLNAFAGTMREELLMALRGASASRVVVITGAGRAFCAGGDVEFMASLQRENDIDAFRRLLNLGAEIVTTIAEMPPIVIAAINGVAAGAGCNLALACDYRIAADTAKLGETFVRIGLHPDWGGTWLLPRLVGRGRALELLASGRMVDAAEALAIGMVDRVVPAAELADATKKLAASFAAGPVAAIKRAVRASERNNLRAQLALEAEHQIRAFQSDEARAKIAAFAKARHPEPGKR
jgi:2-(1,2-epoxy-1,2-dihydrophenyl)acetyl-CoA isomerase